MLSSVRLPIVENLMSLNPAKHGYLMKKSNSVMPSICPCIFPQFKSRFFVLIGNFLFRYPDEHAGSKPKGVPIPLDAVRIIRLDAVSFKLSMLSKEYVMRGGNEDIVSDWIHEITKRKSQALREQMGHVSYDKRLDVINESASRAFMDKINRNQQSPYDLGGPATMNPLQGQLL